ncbi:MAG: HlyC/CorC family transporter [Planctomycetes bacterium]|nr:HlyC/CorC family transporter [Planctomycetota bacterium]
MEALGKYHPFWLAAGAAVLLAAAFIAVCRRSLEAFSRKSLLKRAGAEAQERLEASLSLKDEYAGNLESICMFLRMVFTACLVFGRLVWLESHLLAGTPAGDGSLRGAAHVSELSLAVQVAQLGLLAGEIIAVVFVGLRLIPFVVARVAAESWLLRFLPAVERVYRWTRPLRRFEDSLIRGISFLLGAPGDRTSADIVEEEILEAVEEGEREGILKSRDIDMIESIISYGTVEVSEVMTPRTEMVALDLDRPLDENLEEVIRCGHSRIPVFRGSKDNIVGLLYVKDLQKFWIRREDILLEKIVRPPSFVSFHMKIGELLQDFRKHHQHLAIVRDEHGGTAGLVTIEDILEEIVGEISDEYETHEALLRWLRPDLVEVDASMHIDDLNDQLHISIPEEDSYDTIGGYVLELHGRIPGKGDALETDGVRIEIAEADDRRIHRLRIHLPQKPAVPSQSSPVAAPREAGQGETKDAGDSSSL